MALSAEVIAAVLITAAVVVAFFLALLFFRRRAIAHGYPLMLGAAREHEGAPWRERLLRLDGDGLALFTMGGISLRPDAQFERRSLDLGSARHVESGLPQLLQRRACVAVSVVDAAGGPMEILLAEGDYMALRSWQESMPPAPGQPNVF